MSKTVLLFVFGIVVACIVYVHYMRMPPPLAFVEQGTEDTQRPEDRAPTSPLGFLPRKLIVPKSQDQSVQQGGLAEPPVTSTTTQAFLPLSDSSEAGSPDNEEWVDPLTEGERAEVRRQFEEQWRRQRVVRMAVLNGEEEVDPKWAPAMERQLISFVRGFLRDHPALFERFSVTSVECKTTVCSVQVADYGNAEYSRGVDPILELLEETIEQPWATSFDRPDSHYSGSNEYGFLQYGFYFKKEDLDRPQTQSLAASVAVD